MRLNLNNLLLPALFFLAEAAALAALFLFFFDVAVVVAAAAEVMVAEATESVAVMSARAVATDKQISRGRVSHASHN